METAPAPEVFEAPGGNAEAVETIPVVPAPEEPFWPETKNRGIARFGVPWQYGAYR